MAKNVKSVDKLQYLLQFVADSLTNYIALCIFCQALYARKRGLRAENRFFCIKISGPASKCRSGKQIQSPDESSSEEAVGCPFGRVSRLSNRTVRIMTPVTMKIPSIPFPTRGSVSRNSSKFILFTSSQKTQDQSACNDRGDLTGNIGTDRVHQQEILIIL